MRLRSETIAQKTGLAPTADHIVKMARIDEAIVAVSSEEELMDRLNGFFVALEYLVVCEFSVKDGPITYIKELQAFRRETPGLAFLVQADKLFRKEIARLTSDERSTFTSFSQALLHVLQNCKHLLPPCSKRPALPPVLRREEANGSEMRIMKRSRLTPRFLSARRSRQLKLRRRRPKLVVEVVLLQRPRQKQLQRVVALTARNLRSRQPSGLSLLL